MSVAEQFSGLNIQNLIGGPLTAAADARISLARSTAEFINDVGFDANGKIRTADFGYQKRSVNDDGTSNLEEMKVAVPMLAIVPIPNLQIDEVNILFDMEVKQSEKSESSKDLSASLSGSAKFGPVKVNISGSVSSHESNTRSSDNSAKYHVDVRATNHGTPEGLSRVLDMMAACISPTLVSSELRDGNGQNLSDNAKIKADNLKRIRGELAEIQGRVDASKNSLDSIIQRMKNTAIAQQNAYQAKVTTLLNSLDKDAEDYEEKTDKISEAMSEVNSAWTNFTNRTPDLIKIYADSNPSDNDKNNLSGMFGLMALVIDEKDLSKCASTSYTSSESQYAAMVSIQNSAVDVEKQYDQMQEELIEKNLEYNNAVSGNALPNSGGTEVPAKPVKPKTGNAGQ